MQHDRTNERKKTKKTEKRCARLPNVIIVPFADFGSRYNSDKMVLEFSSVILVAPHTQKNLVKSGTTLFICHEWISLATANDEWHNHTNAYFWEIMLLWIKAILWRHHFASLIWSILSLFLSAFAFSFCLSFSPLFLLTSQLPQFALSFLLCERYSTLALVMYAALSKPLKLFSLHTYLTLIIHVFFSGFSSSILPSSPSSSFQNYLPFHPNKNKLSEISLKPTQGKEWKFFFVFPARFHFESQRKLNSLALCLCFGLHHYLLFYKPTIFIVRCLLFVSNFKWTKYSNRQFFIYVQTLSSWSCFCALQFVFQFNFFSFSLVYLFSRFLHFRPFPSNCYGPFHKLHFICGSIKWWIFKGDQPPFSNVNHFNWD